MESIIKWQIGIPKEDKRYIVTARLPYDVKVSTNNFHNLTLLSINPNGIVEVIPNNGYPMEINWEDCKPYLFPLSSMTEEQKQEYTNIINYISSDDTENWKEGEFIYIEQFTQLMHFYHINHLDYRGLISMGLAKNAVGLNIYH